MFNFLKRKSAIDDDFYPWCVEFTEWIIENFDGLEQLQKTPLVTPTQSYFPKTQKTGHDFAEHLAQSIKTHAGISDWDCLLTAQQRSAPGFIEDIATQDFTEKLPLGTFSSASGRSGRTVEITYDPALLERPASLIATLSHEFAHYLMTTAKSPPPGGWSEEEPATDGLAIFMGFGIFITNSGFDFQTSSQGWSWQRAGYLCEGEALHALSAFLLVSGNSLREAQTYLKPHLAKRLTRIYYEMAKQPEFIHFANG